MTGVPTFLLLIAACAGLGLAAGGIEWLTQRRAARRERRYRDR